MIEAQEPTNGEVVKQETPPRITTTMILTDLDNGIDRIGIQEKYGLEIHARSVFLQGLLLMEPSMIPKRLSKVKDHQICVQNLVQSEGRSMLDVAISYVESLEEIDSVVYGVTALSELKKILEVERLDVPRDITRQAELKNTEILDPRKW